jgi:hypothetical protein
LECKISVLHLLGVAKLENSKLQISHMSISFYSFIHFSPITNPRANSKYLKTQNCFFILFGEFLYPNLQVSKEHHNFLKRANGKRSGNEKSSVCNHHV